MRKRIHEDPDDPHKVFGIQSFREPGSITFLTMGDALFWGPTDGNKHSPQIYHGNITEIFDEALYKINDVGVDLDNAVSEMKVDLNEGGINYKGDLKSALKRFKQVGEDRDSGEELFGRYWARTNTVSFWGPDKMVFDRIKQIYNVLKTIGIRNPEAVKWDFEYGHDYDSDPEETLQSDLKMPIGKVTIGDVMRKSLGGKFKAKDDTEEDKERRKLRIAYHTETDPRKKRAIAQKLGMIKPTSNKLGMPQWQADMYRGVAESTYKQSIMEMYNVKDNRKSIADVILAESNMPDYTNTSLKDFMKSKNLI